MSRLLVNKVQKLIDTNVNKDTTNSRIATTTTGSPAAGYFYSSITNRAPIPDLSADSKVRMGVERIMTQQIYRLQNEFGPNGEPVWGVVNDTFGQIRLVGGNWLSLTGTYGSWLDAVYTTGSTSYLEVTFYGTGLNMLIVAIQNVTGLLVSVDGGSNSSISIPSASSILGARNYSPNAVVNMVSNLTLGIHTVKISYSAGWIQPTGFEILNESSSLKVTPGFAYEAGMKLNSSATEQTIAYNSGFESGTLGTRGGRVVVYQKMDGTIAKAVTPVDTLAKAFTYSGTGYAGTAADHSNEEVARVYHFREFGASRNSLNAGQANDDFSSLGASASNRAFTLDDGTTTLLCSNYNMPQNFGLGEGIASAVGAGDYITFTFIGTGLDIINVRNATSTTSYTVTIDGVTVLTSTVIGGNGLGNTVKIVSGLPYGTHTVKIQNTTGGITFMMGSFIVYQPKKPTIPNGAIELADYNIMADFVANTTAGFDTIATGVLRKYCSREFTYVNGSGGSVDWSLPAVDVANYIGGFETNTNRTGYMEYTFWGTGFEYRTNSTSNRSANISVTLNGQAATVANFPSLVSSTYGTGVTFSAGVMDLNDASLTNGAGVRVSGLPLAKYTVRFTNNTAGSYITFNALDVITPIHSHKSNLYADLQNTLPVGSNSISDNRKFAKSLETKKTWAQAVGVTSNPSTNSTSYIPMPDMSVTHYSKTGLIKISCYMSLQHDTFNANVYIEMRVNGTGVGKQLVWRQYLGSAVGVGISGQLIVPVPPGYNKIDVHWYTNLGAVTSPNTDRVLTVEDI